MLNVEIQMDKTKQHRLVPFSFCTLNTEHSSKVLKLTATLQIEESSPMDYVQSSSKLMVTIGSRLASQ